MKWIMSAMLLVTISWITVVSPAKGDGLPIRDERVAEMVKAQVRDEKIMPEPQVQLERLAKGLELTEEQQKQIKPVLDREYARFKEIRHREDMSPKQIQKKIEGLRSDIIDQIQKYLTPEQKEKYDLVNKEIKANKERRIEENRKKRLDIKAEPPEKP
jgi:hypothetical protein